MFEQKPGVLIHPKVDRDVEPAAAHFVEASQALIRLPGPESPVFGEEIVRADLVRDAEPARELNVPRSANQGYVIGCEGVAQLFQCGQCDQEVAVMVELQDQQPPPVPPFE